MTKYYLSELGSDTNDGLSQDTAWKTTSKLKAIKATLRPGDTIALRCGDTFYGRVEVDNSRGTNSRKITVTSFGTGKKPVVSCYKHAIAAGWVQHAPNIWKIDLTDVASYWGNIYEADVARGVNVGFLRVGSGFLASGFEIKPVKRWSVAELSAQWEFYSDEGRWCYVYSTQNPKDLSGDIRFSVGSSIFGSGIATRWAGLEAIGCAGHGLNGSLQAIEMVGCTLHEIGGGHLIGFSQPNTRYGNGIEAWTGSKSVNIEGNEIYDIYDVACTMQGRDVTTVAGWEDVWFRYNTIYRCNQTFEVWSTGDVNGYVPPNAGFFRTGFENNICIDAGKAWSSEVRPDTATRAHLLLYKMEATKIDISVRHNVFHGVRDYFIARPAGVQALPVGYVVEDNQVFMALEQRIFTGSVHTAAEWEAFVAELDCGHGCIVEHLVDLPDSVELAVSKLLNYANVQSAISNVTWSAISSLNGRLAALSSEVATLEADTAHGAYLTQQTEVSQDGYARLLTTTIRSDGGRFDTSFFYMVGMDSTINRNGIGIVNLQVVPVAGLGVGTYVDMDVVELLPFRTGGLQASDFKAVITREDGTAVTVDIFFNIGKDNYLHMVTRPLAALSAGQPKVSYRYINYEPLLSVLPAGPVKAGSTTDLPYILQPTIAAGAPSFIPSRLGQEFIDNSTTPKKVYKATGITAIGDWVALN